MKEPIKVGRPMTNQNDVPFSMEKGCWTGVGEGGRLCLVVAMNNISDGTRMLFNAGGGEIGIYITRSIPFVLFRAFPDSADGPEEDLQENVIEARSCINGYMLEEEKRSRLINYQTDEDQYPIVNVFLVEASPPPENLANVVSGIRVERLLPHIFERTQEAMHNQLQEYGSREEVREAEKEIRAQRDIKEMASRTTMVKSKKETPGNRSVSNRAPTTEIT